MPERKILLIENGKWNKTEVAVIEEMPVSLTINGELMVTLRCTPRNLEDLAIGFMYNEGWIHSYDEVVSTRVCPTSDNVDIWLNHGVEKPRQWEHTSGCTGGVTSQRILEQKEMPVMTGDLSLAAEKVVQLMHLLFDSQKQHREIGGTHASILSDGENILCAAEDIGRHNTIDKLAGMCLIQGIDPKKYILITTGRISSDMVQKAVRMGVPILISRTSPTSLSIDFAEYWGLTLVGYARGNRFTIYTHPERISA